MAGLDSTPPRLKPWATQPSNDEQRSTMVNEKGHTGRDAPRGLLLINDDRSGLVSCASGFPGCIGQRRRHPGLSD